jgi:hypothetical protein
MTKNLKAFVVLILLFVLSHKIKAQIGITVYDTVHNYATSEYKDFKVRYLISKLFDQFEDNAARKYAAMGIENHSYFIADTLKKEIVDSLYQQIKIEKENVPSDLLRLFINFGGSKRFVLEQLGDNLKNHTFEMEFLDNYEDKKYVKTRLSEMLKNTKPIQGDEKQMSKFYAISEFFISLCDAKGIDMLMPLLTKNNYKCRICRERLYLDLVRTIEKSSNWQFRTTWKNDEQLEILTTKLTSWWKRNKNTFDICGKTKIELSQEKVFPFSISFVSKCCGVPSNELIIYKIKEFCLKNKITKLQAFNPTISHFDEGEYTWLFTLKELNIKQRTEFINEIKGVIKDYKPISESDGYYKIQQNIKYKNKLSGQNFQFLKYNYCPD